LHQIFLPEEHRTGLAHHSQGRRRDPDESGFKNWSIFSRSQQENGALFDWSWKESRSTLGRNSATERLGKMSTLIYVDKSNISDREVNFGSGLKSQFNTSIKMKTNPKLASRFEESRTWLYSQTCLEWKARDRLNLLVTTGLMYIVKWSFGQKILFVITECSLHPMLHPSFTVYFFSIFSRLRITSTKTWAHMFAKPSSHSFIFGASHGHSFNRFILKIHINKKYH